MRILITGGAGFIGSDLIRKLIHDTSHQVLNLDKLTYAANLDALKNVEGHDNYNFIKADICDNHAVADIINDFKPESILHLAAESHVDRSIHDASDFIQTNINGTYHLLNAFLSYWQGAGKPDHFKFIHVSTDEVYGSLAPNDPAFTEKTAYAPNSPYSASKASSDHLARSYYETFGLPVIITHCSNNYGPWQNKEKLIPLMTLNALAGKKLPVYGTGENIRDWIFVRDHVEGLLTALDKGKIGEVYNLGGENEIRNIDIVNTICTYLDEHAPRKDGKPYAEQIEFVEDRLGHDKRYAINNDKMKSKLGWAPQYSFDQGLIETIQWYVSRTKGDVK